jgi:alpha-L-fucosidase
MRFPVNPPEWWQKQWLDRITDLIDQHKPDLLYTDGGIPFGDVGRELIARYYNRNMAWHSGDLEAVYTIKNYGSDDSEHGEYRDGIAVEDLERGVLKGIKDLPWQTDTSVADWYYRTGHAYKSATDIIHMLADIVSKNGNLLMNFTQKADGTLDPESEQLLGELAEWMPVNGEAIFNTRPWHTFGEGPTEGTAGHFKEDTIPYTARDMRFTTKGDALYAILLAWPADRCAVIRSLGESTAAGSIRSVRLLGHDDELNWSRDSQGLQVELPPSPPTRHAHAIRVQLGD